MFLPYCKFPAAQHKLPFVSWICNWLFFLKEPVLFLIVSTCYPIVVWKTYDTVFTISHFKVTLENPWLERRSQEVITWWKLERCQFIAMYLTLGWGKNVCASLSIPASSKYDKTKTVKRNFRRLKYMYLLAHFIYKMQSYKNFFSSGHVWM